MFGGLEQLASDGFQSVFGSVSTTQALLRVLRRTPAVRQVRESLASEQLSDGDLRAFVAELLHAWSPGRLFPHDVALAAIAVVLESRFTSFADEYLHDLARLRAPEVPKATRVARLCLEARHSSSQNVANRFLVAPSRVPLLPWQDVPPMREVSADLLVQPFDAGAALCQN
jgi:hypothetical protein